MSESEVTVTLKGGKEFDKSWIVLRGDVGQVRESLLATFQIPEASVSALSLAELVTLSADVFQGKSANLAAVATSASVTTKAESVATPAADDSEDPWASAAKAQGGKPEPGPNPLLAMIEACKDTDALKALWAKNQAAFADADVMSAWKARGKKLQVAA